VEFSPVLEVAQVGVALGAGYAGAGCGDDLVEECGHGNS
jgi:hypothetical protein